MEAVLTLEANPTMEDGGTVCYIRSGARKTRSASRINKRRFLPKKPKKIFGRDKLFDFGSAESVFH